MQLQQTLTSPPLLVRRSHLCFPAAGLARVLPDVPSLATVNNSSRCEVLTTDLITSCNRHLPSAAPPPVTQHKGRAGRQLVGVWWRALGRAAGQQSGWSCVCGVLAGAEAGGRTQAGREGGRNSSSQSRRLCSLFVAVVTQKILKFKRM